ncbi:MAG: hypothetical protein HY847_14155 [Betaproteobacteria bacterium]|nr:hypothetical protein [Betaproteobacteria bacterium]
MRDYYVDHLGNMTVQGSAARLEFMRMNSFDPEKKEAKLSPSLSLVMPIASLLQLSAAAICFRVWTSST